MASIDRQPVRAEISFIDSSAQPVATPYVVSFNVRRARGQMSATFSASLKVESDKISDSFLGKGIIIKAGIKNQLKTIFTGRIYKATIKPIWTDASLVMLNLAGKDTLGVIEAQKINRRVKTYRDGSTPPERWGMVNQILKDNSPTRAVIKAGIDTNQIFALYNAETPPVTRTKPGYAGGPERNKITKLPGITGRLVPSHS